MANDKHHAEVIGKLGGIEVELKGVNKRLDLVNNSIAKAKNRIRTLEDKDLTNSVNHESSSKIKRWLLDNAATILTGLVLAYLIWKFGIGR